MNKKLLFEQELQNFQQNGPYTFAETVRLAKKSTVLSSDFSKLLDQISHKFPPQEFQKLLKPMWHLSSNEFIDWKRKTLDWMPVLSRNHSNEHIELISDNIAVVKDIFATFEIEKLSKAKIVAVLHEMRNAQARDASPERNKK